MNLRAYKPYTLVGPTIMGLVSTPLAVQTPQQPTIHSTLVVNKGFQATLQELILSHSAAPNGSKKLTYILLSTHIPF